MRECSPVPVHVLDQSGQPYGSVRKCCNGCGFIITPELILVDTMEDWYKRIDKCTRPRPFQV